jgi:hypothetical protein
MTTYETTPLDAAVPIETATHAKLRSHEVWAAPLIALAAAGAFAMVVNLVRFGFARDWLDPAGYVLALLKPLVLTFPGYLVLRVVIGRSDLTEEVAVAARALRRASLSIACYAPVIWFYLVTSPTPAHTFPIIAFSFGALAFWAPLVFDLSRSIGKRGGALLSVLWISLMVVAEARTMLAWLAEGVAGRLS